MTILTCRNAWDTRKYILTIITNLYFFDSWNHLGTFFALPNWYTVPPKCSICGPDFGIQRIGIKIILLLYFSHSFMCCLSYSVFTTTEVATHYCIISKTNSDQETRLAICYTFCWKHFLSSLIQFGNISSF